MFGDSNTNKSALGYVLPALTAGAVVGSALMMNRIWSLESKLASEDELEATSRLADRMQKSAEKARLNANRTQHADVDESLAAMQSMIEKMKTGVEM